MTATAEPTTTSADGVPEAAARARHVLVRALSLEVAVLTATGLYLMLFYRPSSAQAWGEVYGDAGSSSSWSFLELGRSVHLWTSRLTILTAVVLAIVAVVEAVLRWRPPARRRIGALSGPVLLLMVALAVVSGGLIAWDQLGLWEVTVGTNMRGFAPVFGDRVRFAIVDGAQIDVSTLRFWVVMHLLLLPLAIVSCLMATDGRRRLSQPGGRDRQDIVLAAKL